MYLIRPVWIGLFFVLCGPAVARRSVTVPIYPYLDLNSGVDARIVVQNVGDSSQLVRVRAVSLNSANVYIYVRNYLQGLPFTRSNTATSPMVAPCALSTQQTSCVAEKTLTASDRSFAVYFEVWKKTGQASDADTAQAQIEVEQDRGAIVAFLMTSPCSNSCTGGGYNSIPINGGRPF